MACTIISNGTMPQELKEKLARRLFDRIRADLKGKPIFEQVSQKSGETRGPDRAGVEKLSLMVECSPHDWTAWRNVYERFGARLVRRDCTKCAAHQIGRRP